MKDEAKLTIRLPIELKAWLASTAVMNRRSQNAEIAIRLEAARTAEAVKAPASAGGAPTTRHSLEA